MRVNKKYVYPSLHFHIIIFPYLSAKKKELGYPVEQGSLIIMNTLKGQGDDEMKGLSTKNNYELIIVSHNLNNKFQALDLSVN